MTIKKPALATSALLLAFVSFFSLSQAALAAPCTEQVEALKSALNDGNCSFGKACMGLSHKLDNANHKLEQAKFSLAARRLEDFGAIIQDMAMRRKPLVSMADYEALMDPYFKAAAICIANGGASSNDDTDSTPDGGETDDPFDGQMF